MVTSNNEPQTEVHASLADDPSVRAIIDLARREDLGTGDLSTDLLPDPLAPASFRLIAKQAGVFAGEQVARAILAAYDEAIELEWRACGRDGAVFTTLPAEIAMIRGPVGSVLQAERVLLNFLQRLSGIATLTRRYVEAVVGTGARVLDTRKTTPGWRMLEKYAVRCGGGHNHRAGLFDAVLIKDNHLAGIATQRLAPAVFAMLNTLSGSGARPAFVEVEVDSLDALRELLKVVGIQIILLDNFSVNDMRAAVELRNALGVAGRVLLEASGGVTLDTIREIAGTGVDRISVGAITHSAVAIDLSLERC